MHAGRSAEEVLSAEQLCQRRLDNVRQLKELYEIELLNALEEQRSRQCHSRMTAPGGTQDAIACTRTHALAGHQQQSIFHLTYRHGILAQLRGVVDHAHTQHGRSGEQSEYTSGLVKGQDLNHVNVLRDGRERSRCPA